MNFITTKYDYALDLLEDIVKADHPLPTDLVICSTREDFHDQLLTQLARHHDELRPSATSPAQDESNGEADDVSPTGRSHPLLAPTLQVLSASRFCSLRFCPTTTVLRGYLASYYLQTVSKSSAPTSSFEGRVVILNLLALHHGTSEFTLQGLSQTLATAVSAAHGAKRQLELVECRDIHDPSNPSRGPALWQADVQLLSGAVKIGEGGASWGRRSISVMMIASRWFQIRHPGREDKEDRSGSLFDKGAATEDEMLV
ncbi:hypothetical protein A1O3_05111 [Capronia epimyces CBS 606.96]|uniref:Uncharacterized protein n=1 Tax=Capronia epimyces CBS 606.96 TaxID=1182542 RepID=W9XW49_9EURO|nr:uncharacterized protein A1O3_05111 [Capronia epimyces CBS 606.96]EXJ84443.1 hypothetical protein A1O3_05111 [Capronia epimyces CBS 606.96]